MRYLLDTTTVSEPLRTKPAAGVMRRLRKYDGETAIPAPVWHQLRCGCARLPPSRRRQVIEHYLESVVLVSFPVLNYDRAAADWHAQEHTRLSAIGRTPPFVEGQIAAIAYINDLVLISSNAVDFRDFQGLKVRSWA